MYQIGILALLALAAHAQAAANQHAIAGGGFGSDTPYISLISNTGVATPISGALPVGNGQIASVSINATGYALVGGQDHNSTLPYAALVSPLGTATAISGSALPSGNGIIQSVAINASANGLIGGQQSGTSLPYAALVNPSGATTGLSGPHLYSGTGRILAVAINDSGYGVIGGRDQGDTNLYAALIAPSGITTALSGAPLPATLGLINSVAINQSGNGVIGGEENGGASPYAVLFNANGVRTALSGPAAPIGAGDIRSVAINNSGSGILGGEDNSAAFPYAALFNANGVRTALSGSALPVGSGVITSVAINQSGNCILGGQHNGGTATYLALVSPTGITTPITGDLAVNPSYVQSVAIADSGIAIAGGTQNISTDDTYLVLISPLGVATSVTGYLPAAPSIINSVSIVNAATPSALGPTFGAPPISALLAATQAVTNHADIFQNWHARELKTLSKKQKRKFEETALLTEADELALQKLHEKRARPTPLENPHLPLAATPFSIWAAPFYANIYQKQDDAIPTSRNQIPGIVAGVDFWPTDRLVLGGGLAYAFDYLRLPSLGHAKINQGMAVYYTSYSGDYVFVNASLWGGYYHIDNTRLTLGFIPSRANIHGWLLSPHFELCVADCQKSAWFVVEPFLMLDWVNNWQRSFTEHGAAGLNLSVGGLYNSLLRSELGLGFYQILTYDWGRFMIQERASYINKAPFNFNPTSVSFVGSPSTFSIETGTNHTQNLAGARINLSFLPYNPTYPYGLITFFGEFSPTYQSYLASFELGKDF